MSRTYSAEPCWVIRDTGGAPWDEEHDVHNVTRESAEVDVRDIHSEQDEDLSPAEIDAEAARITERFGEEAGRRSLTADTKRAARLASLHAVALPGPCYSVECDGCGAKPESDDWGDRLHFSDFRDQFEPAEHDWRSVNGLDYCDECAPRMLCVECDGLRGEGGNEDEGMCAACWAKDQASPGPLDVPLFTAGSN